MTSIVFRVMLYVAEALQSDDTKMLEAFKRRLRRHNGKVHLDGECRI